MPKFPTSNYPPPPPVDPENTGLDKLFNANRVLGESRMIRTEATPEEVTPDQIQGVIDRVKAYLKERSVSQAQVASGICYGGSVVSQVLKGTYAADARPIIIAMDRWLERRRRADNQPETSRYTDTSVAKMIRLAGQMAIRASDAGVDSRIALVWGDPGCGKTWALEAVAESEQGIFITCGVKVLSARGVLEEIAGNLRCGVARSTRETFAVVVDKLRGSGKLIVVDEIHALLDAHDDSAFHTLRRLSDETGCPQLWGATCDLIEQLKIREKKRDPLGQITSRIGCQFHLTAKLHGGGGGGRPEPLYSVEEIVKMYGANELKLTSDGAHFLANVCRDPNMGLLRSCTKLVLHATTMNRAKGGAITARMLWEAAQFTFQYSMIQRLQVAVHENLRDMKLKLATA